jgi:hypothetical protein
VSPAHRRTPPDQQAVSDDDLDGPTSAVRPIVPLLAVPWLAITVEGLHFLPLDARSAYLLSLDRETGYDDAQPRRGPIPCPSRSRCQRSTGTSSSRWDC